MKKLRVPIFTEEYAINVYIGKRDEVCRAAARYMECDVAPTIKSFEGQRGRAFNCFPDWNPLIIIDGSLPAHIALATVAHEASHSMDDIADHINLHHTEFRAHGIAAVMRIVGNTIAPKGWKK